MTLEKFVEQLKQVYGPELKSAVLYGSAAAGDFQKKHSDYNLLVVLDDISLSALGRSAKLCQKWMRHGHPLPLFVDREHLNSSRDVFPIEFYDIKERHRVLHGEDPFLKMDIANRHLRLQCEGELKAKIIALRSEYLRLYPSKRKIKKLILRSSSSFFAIFRGVLRLLGEKVPSTRHGVLVQLDAKTALGASVLEKVLEIREGKRDLGRGEVLGLAEEYLTSLEKVSSFVDQLS